MTFPPLAESREEKPRTRRNVLRLLLVIATSLLATLPVWIAEYPPMVDLPQHAAQIALIDALRDPSFRFGTLFQINWFTPYLLGYLLVHWLTPTLGILTACKVVIALSVAGMPIATALLLQELDGDGRWAVFTIPVQYGFAYQWGFLNFIVGGPLGLLFLLATVRYARRESVGLALLLALSVNVLFFCHALICLFFAVIAALYLFEETKPAKGTLRRFAPLAAVVPVMVIWTLRSLADSTPRLPVYGDYDLLGTQEPYYGWLARWTTVGGWQWGRLTGFIPRLFGERPSLYAFVMGALLFGIPIVAAADLNRRRSRWLPFLVCLWVLLFVPHTVFGTAFTYQRFALFVVPFYLVGLSCQPKRSWSRWIWPVGLLLALASVGVAASHARGYSEDASGFDEILRTMQPNQRALSFVFDRDSNDTIAPTFLHFAVWYAPLMRGVVDPSAAVNPLAVARYRGDHQPKVRPIDFEWEPEGFDWNTHQGVTYRYFIVRATSDRGSQIFRTAPCQGRLLNHVKRWWVYEASPDCAAAEVSR